MAADESIPSPRSAVFDWLEERMSARDWVRARPYVMRLAFRRDGASLDAYRVSPEVRRVLELAPVYLDLAGRWIARDLVRDRVHVTTICRQLPRPVVEEAARVFLEDAKLWRRVMAQPPMRRHLATIANSVFLRVNPEWRPDPSMCRSMRWALLEDAQWAGIELDKCYLRGVRFDHADLTGASFVSTHADSIGFRWAKLRGACFDGAEMASARFHGADVRDASFEKTELVNAAFSSVRAEGACFRGTRLTRGNLTDGSFAGAEFCDARLDAARLAGADFRDCDFEGANLARLDLRDASFEGASFVMATMRHCIFDGLRLVAPNFRQAELSETTWTGARMRHADLRGANLTGAGLAHVDWHGADLRGADLTHASFHLGSSRSGLVPGTTASEGTRTGFYTDEFCEQSFFAPEQIRKANLRFADLRGARVEDCDFYLVDLRGARFDADQRRHFERSKAIL